MASPAAWLIRQRAAHEIFQLSTDARREVP